MINNHHWEQIVQKIEANRGSLTLLAVVLREESPERWDVVVAAPWLDPSKRETYEYLAKTISDVLSKEEMRLISRIVPVAIDDPLLKRTLKRFCISRDSEAGWKRTDAKPEFMGMDVSEIGFLVAKAA